MPASKAEQVLEAMKALLEAVPGATVERNSVLPEKIPPGGLIILRDGDPGEPERALGGFGSTYYQHPVEIEVYVEEARRAVEAIERQARERTEAGLALDRLPDLSAEAERDGFYQAQLIRELAVRHIASWTGVELEGGPAPPTPENIAAVMNLYPVGERFFQEFTLRQVLLNAAKNGSGLSAAGTSSQAEGPTTAEPAATTTCPAPEASPVPTDGSARTGSTR